MKQMIEEPLMQSIVPHFELYGIYMRIRIVIFNLALSPNRLRLYFFSFFAQQRLPCCAPCCQFYRPKKMSNRNQTWFVVIAIPLLHPEWFNSSHQERAQGA